MSSQLVVPHFIITGVTGGSPNRLEINDFVKNDKFFSLYIQALQAMYTTNQVDIKSFFSVGGIHGLPYQTWDDARGDPDPEPDQWLGYCTHGSVLFPTWHRPYVLLYEQILQQHAVEIARTYLVNTDDWKKAAADLRQPYWDWASNIIPPPQVISQKLVTITNNLGKQVKVSNPLFNYKFHPIDSSFPDPYSNWQTTLRHPTSGNSDATSDLVELQNSLASDQSQITTSTYNMLTRVHTWPAFSNHSIGDGGSKTNSLEAIHDNIHVDVGGLELEEENIVGHMSDPSVAGFDPIFFLHHANVDRMLSLWAALNPGTWVTPGPADGGSFTAPADSQYDKTSPLTPFWNAQTSFWASAGLTDTRKLGYSYPEFNGLDPANTTATRIAIGFIVNNLYGNIFSSLLSDVPPHSISVPISTLADTPKQVPLAAATQARSLPAKAASHNPAPSQQHPQVPAHQISLDPSPQHEQQSSAAAPNHGMYDWTARVEFKKYELKSSFSVLIFIGEVPENPREWRSSPSYVGGHHAFVNSAASRCSNCTNQQDVIVEGFVHLSRAIAQHSGLPSLDPEVVVPYLTHNLHWRVQKSGEVELQSLEVTVTATPLSYPPGSMFPVPGEVQHYNRITYGRNGGSRQP